jgi:type IX secretion system PorP/SprF family membrane protein
MTKIYIYSVFAFLFINLTINAQENLYLNQNKLLGALNPSFYGFKEAANIGVANTNQKISNEDSYIQNTFAFGSFYFEDYNFSLALDVNSFQNSALGFNATQANVHYIHKTKLTYNWTMNASLSLGYGNNRLDFSSLIFGDQIDPFSGSIIGFSRDPVTANNNIRYFDTGASAHAHNNKNMFFGLSIKHLNNPNVSLNNDSNDTKDLYISVQAGYELDLNPVGQSFLPEDSFLFLYSSFSKQASKSRISLYQEILLNNFSFGVNQHLNSYEGIGLGSIGTSASVFFNQIEIGINYSFEIASKSITSIPYNYFEVYMVFDFSRILGRFSRGSNSRFSNF